jgi:membrane-associated protease RseP (regulator of RpoE activity)
MVRNRLLGIVLALSAATVAGGQKPVKEMQMRSGVVRSAWIGFGIACSYCSMRDDSTGRRWTFGGPPVIVEISPNGPAAHSTLSLGDTIKTIDGLDILSPEGGRRFGSITGGVPVRFGFSHGKSSGVATITPYTETAIQTGAEAADSGRAQSAAQQRAMLKQMMDSAVLERKREMMREAIDKQLDAAMEKQHAVQSTQFTGSVAGANIEVRGANVHVTSDESTGTLVIRGDKLVVTVKPAGGK